MIRQKINYLKIRSFFKSILNGIIGICAELALVAVFTAAGFLACLMWWGFFR